MVKVPKSLSSQEITDLSYSDLRSLCGELGLGGRGSRVALQTRLRAYYSGKSNPSATSRTRFISRRKTASPFLPVDKGDSSSSDSESDTSASSTEKDSKPKSKGRRTVTSARRKSTTSSSSKKPRRSKSSRRSLNSAGSGKSKKTTTPKTETKKAASATSSKSAAKGKFRLALYQPEASTPKGGRGGVASPTIASRAASLAGPEVSFPDGIVSPTRHVTPVKKAKKGAPSPFPPRSGPPSAFSSARKSRSASTSRNNMDAGSDTQAPHSATKKPRRVSSIVPEQPGFFAADAPRARLARKSTHLGEELEAHYAARRESLVLWKRPTAVLYLFSRVIYEHLSVALGWINRHGVLMLLGGIAGIAYLWVRAAATASGDTNFVSLPSPPEEFEAFEHGVVDVFWWVGLGVISAIGLGSGIPTFILYLGPHLVALSVGAHECSLEGTDHGLMGCLAAVWRQGWWPAMLWGAGTALGELPPYFVFRAAARRSPVADAIRRRDELAAKESRSLAETYEYWQSWGQAFAYSVVHRAGFVGIMLFASIPNPLYDLAGMISGYLGLSFWTFFLATLIGKGVIKVNIQVLGIAIMMSEKYMNMVVSAVQSIVHRFVEVDLLAMAHEFRDDPFGDHGGEMGMGKKLWSAALYLILGSFVVSVIHDQVQSFQEEADAGKIRRRVRDAKAVASGKKEA